MHEQAGYAKNDVCEISERTKKKKKCKSESFANNGKRVILLPCHALLLLAPLTLHFAEDSKGGP